MTTSRDFQPHLAVSGPRLPHTWVSGDPLTASEQALIDHAAAGELLSLGKPETDRKKMEEWSPDRTIRAAVLLHLLVAPEWSVHAKGVRLTGARISGVFDLESTVLRCPLLLDACLLEDPHSVVLDYATVPRLALSGCHLAGLSAEMLVVKQVLALDDSTLSGPVRLPGADIAGAFSCRGARLTGADGNGNALVAETVKVGGHVLFDEGFTTDGALRLLGADISGQLSCRGARLTGADTDGDALIADGVKVGGDVFLDQGFTADGAVRLSGAHITGQLNCRGARLTGADTDGNALIAEAVKVGGHVLLDQGFTTAGAVRLLGADITGQLSCRGARLTGADTDGNALVADQVKVGGSVFLDEGFTTDGAVRLHGADITGQLSCRGARLTGADTDGNALIADQVKVGGDVFLDQGFTADGAVRLLGADITGQLNCAGARLTGANTDGNALIADNVKVGGDVFLDERFTAAGAVSLTAGRIDGAMSLAKAELTGPVALRAAGVRVGHELRWEPRSPVKGLVDLERAAVQRLDDDWSLPSAHWPPAGKLLLAGLVYDGFGGTHQADWSQRLDWIRRHHTTPVPGQRAAFATQPYEQLARVYRQAGQDSDARAIAIARRNDLRRYPNLSRLSRPRRVGNWLLDKTIKHGYQPLRAVGLLVAVYLVTVLAFWGAQHHDTVIVPAKDVRTLTPTPTGLHCTASYPCFYPAGYALDVVVPIINVRQAENWRPNGDADWGWAYGGGSWLATGLGWAFSTLAVVGYTGLVRKD